MSSLRLFLGVLAAITAGILAPESLQASSLNWYSQNPTPTGTTLNDICVIDALTAVAVGEAGLILRTNDGGLTWFTQNSGTVYSLDGVSFSDANTGTVVGNGVAVTHGPTILRTTDGGATWVSQQSGDPSCCLLAVDFTDADAGTAVGPGGILRTTDGGDSWTRQLRNPVGGVVDVCFTDADTGTAVGGGGLILRTTNGGNTWVPQTSTTTRDLFSVHFADGSNGIIVGGYYTVLRTTDGGANWVEYVGPYKTLLDVHLSDAYTGTAVGKDGVIYRTNTGGATWYPQNSGTASTLHRVDFFNQLTGMAVGGSGTILRTTDGGATWINSRTAVTGNDLRGVYFTSTNIGIVVGVTGTILGTTDGGESWIPKSSGTTNTLSDVSFTGSSTGTVVGAGGTILRTTDGGDTWVPQTSGTSDHLLGVCFIDEVTGTVVGGPGTILRTTDGGATWVPQVSGTTFGLEAVSFTDTDTGVAVGSQYMDFMYIENVVLWTADGGDTWVQRPSGFTGWLHDVAMWDGVNAIAVGSSNSGLLLSATTSDGGDSWTSLQQSSGSLYNVILSEGGAAVAVGMDNYASRWGGVILSTSDGGHTWLRHISGVDRRLEAVFFTDASSGTAVGNDGTILRTHDPIVAIAIEGFEGHPVEKGILLSWSVRADEKVERIRLLRSSCEGGTGRFLSTVPLSLGNGRFLDRTAVLGQCYSYTLVVEGKESGVVRSPTISVERPVLALQLFQNRPNPFNPSTIIRYNVPRRSRVTLRVYSAMGELVKTLVDEIRPSGSGEIEWNGTNDAGGKVASGVYVYRLRAGNEIVSKKMTVLK